MQVLVSIFMDVVLMLYWKECNQVERRFRLEMEQRERLGWGLVSSTGLKTGSVCLSMKVSLPIVKLCLH